MKAVLLKLHPVEKPKFSSILHRVKYKLKVSCNIGNGIEEFSILNIALIATA